MRIPPKIQVTRPCVEEPPRPAGRSEKNAGIKPRPGSRIQMKARLKPTPLKHIPKVSVPPATTAPVKANTQAVAIKGPSGVQIQKTPDSLPVLEAFQEFLDSEHRRMRNRMIGLSAVFTTIIILLVGGGVFTAVTMLGPIRSDVDTIRSTMATIEETSDATRQNTESALASMSMMLEQEKQSFASTASEIETKVNDYSGNIEHLQGLVNSLQSENSSLKSQLKTIEQEWPHVSYQLAMIMKELDNMKTRVRKPMETSAGTGEYDSGTVAMPASKTMIAAENISAVISFIPSGRNKRVTCLLPIPE